MGTHGAQVLIRAVGRVGFLAGLVVLAGCGGVEAAPEPAASPAEVIQQAVDKMADAGSARFTLSGSLRDKDLSRGRLPITGKGLVRFDRKEGWVWLNVGNLFTRAVAINAPVEQRESLARFLADPKAWRMESRVIGQREWDRMPGVQTLLGGKPWFKNTDPDDNLLTIQPGSLWTSPVGVLACLRALDRVRLVGSQTIDGQQTTHYRGVVRLRSLSTTVKKDRAVLRKSIKTAIRQSGRKKIPLDVWIGEDGLPRRVRLVDIWPINAEEGGTHVGYLRARFDIPEYGLNFDVLRPPASKVNPEKD